MSHTNGADTPRDKRRQDTRDEPEAGRKHTAGLFDIRNMIGTLMGIYGVILLLMGFFYPPELAKTGGWNANLWAGVALAVLAAAMVLWAQLRPTYVPEGAAAEAGDEEVGHP